MSKEKPNVIVIPAKPELSREAVNAHRQLRVAAYCRVSTDEKEQINSYENQKKHYTDTIMKNPAWTLAGIFADEGITGTSANITSLVQKNTAYHTSMKRYDSIERQNF